MRQWPAVGVVEDIRLHLAPVLSVTACGCRRRDLPAAELITTYVEVADGVVHLRYRIRL